MVRTYGAGPCGLRLSNGRWFLNDLSSKATGGRVLILPRPSRNPSGAIGEIEM
jgi:hypothetical protein